MKKFTLTSISIIVSCAPYFGCNKMLTGAGNASANICYRVFELSPDIVDKVIPEDNRTQLENSQYLYAAISPVQMSFLVDSISPHPGLLYYDCRSINWWPMIAFGWGYAKTDGVLFGTGGGGGFLGVRNHFKVRQIRIDCPNISHSIYTRTKIGSKFLYEGPVPDDGILVMICPFEREDGTELFYVIAFEITGWRNN
jgi:hypothetical protein